MDKGEKTTLGYKELQHEMENKIQEESDTIDNTIAVSYNVEHKILSSLHLNNPNGIMTWKNSNMYLLKDMEKLSFLKSTKTTSITINLNTKIKGNKVKEFFEKYFPSDVQHLIFNYPPPTLLKPFSYYSFAFFKAFPKVTKTILLSGVQISQKNFKSLLFNCRHLVKLKFPFCKIDTENLEIKEEFKFQLEELNFHGCGKPCSSDWRKNLNKLESIFNAIKNCNLNDSLNKVITNDCHISEGECREMVERQDLRGVAVIGYFATMFSDEVYKIHIPE